ncbi:hypothetical protein SAMN05443582_103353 [Phyllobacterium sp. OV277]|nr:hypothetical protein SAMN05443582_103353 [Phyllobacterium sp. OV277]
MVRAVQIGCVVVFIAVMIAINQGASWFISKFSGDFAWGCVVGALFTSALVFLILKMEKSSGTGQQPAAHQSRSRDLIDL